jgi:signal peptidase I
MNGKSLRDVVHVAIGVVIAAAVLQTWLVLGWIVPMTVSGSSMAPALLGPHRLYRCPDCRHEFAVGLDQLPLGDLAVCPHCGERRATAAARTDQRGERLAVDRTALAWRAPRRWEVVVFHCPECASDLCVKRVVGLPGETITLDDGDVLVNGQVVRKSLAVQRAVRQLVDGSDDEAEIRTFPIGKAVYRTSSRWRRNDSEDLEYHHVHGGPITDEFSYNQGAAPPTNRAADVMLTFEARLAGAGQLVLTAANDAGRCELIADFSRREVGLKLGERSVAKRPLPVAAVERGHVVEWTLSLFDRQVLLAIGDDVVLAEPLERDQLSGGEPGVPLAIGVRGLTGEIRRVAVWRDVYYAVRHSDGRQRGAELNGAVAWRLGPGEFFVLGDNAAISDDSRNWLSGPGLDAKLLIGKPLGVR